jgi:uncharacterized protein DUF547
MDARRPATGVLTRLISRIAVVFAAAGLVSVTLFAAGAFSRKPIAEQKQPQVQQFSVEEIDHHSWDALLRRYVNEIGLVDYAGWKSNPVDVAALDEYLSLLSQADLERDASRKARLAYWINAYNALTVLGILRDYRSDSIPNSDSRSQPNKHLSNVRLVVGQSSFSLDDIEHEVLHVLNEPQAHFALVCGSRGCPRLSNRAYTGRTLESQFEENARAFFADPSKVAIKGDSEVQLSPILKWYADDSGKTPAEILQSVAPQLPAEIKAKLLDEHKLRISYLDYDWSLNDQAAASTDPPLPPDPQVAPTDSSLGPK